jgi:hypothetical protein
MIRLHGVVLIAAAPKSPLPSIRWAPRTNVRWSAVHERPLTRGAHPSQALAALTSVAAGGRRALGGRRSGRALAEARFDLPP